MAKRTWITAAELMAQLEQDPVWVEKRRQREELWRLKAEQHARDEAPVVQQLREAGAEISSVWDLVNTKASYPELLQILVDQLQRPYPDAVREGIARALAVPEARFAWPLLVKLYRQEPAGQVKSALALAVGNAAGAKELAELITLARDPQLGESRLLLLGALERSRDPRALRAPPGPGHRPGPEEGDQVHPPLQGAAAASAECSEDDQLSGLPSVPMR